MQWLAIVAMLAADPVRVMVVTGGHDHDPSFYAVFQEAKDWQVTVNPHPGAFARDVRKQYDVVLFYDMASGVEEKRRQNLQRFAESGKGIVVMHHALAGHRDWPWWTEELIGGRYRFAPESPVSTYKHDVRFEVTPVGEHPVTRGVGKFTIIDETYKDLWISPQAKILLRTSEPTSDGPVAWISPYAKSRVVFLQLGHDHQAHANPAYGKLVRNAIQWAAGRE